MSDQTIEQMRATADEVLGRARDDEQYRATLLADPVGTLTAAGLSTAAAEHLALEEFTSAEDDTVGHRPRSGARGCDTITCLVTACSNMPFTGSDGCYTLSAVG